MSLEDKAQEHEAKEWELRNTRRPEQPTYKPGEPGYGPEECQECDADMPAKRREYGYRLCTACATEAERARAAGRRR